MIFMMNKSKNSIIAAAAAAVAIAALLGSGFGVADAQVTCGLLPAGTLPQDGVACEDAMPEGNSLIGCMGESYAGSTKTDASCTCEVADPFWKCTTTDTVMEANEPCPSQETPKANGDSCEGQLSQADSSMTCMWSQKVSFSATIDSFNCVCSNAAGSTPNVWSCDGTFPPIVNPTIVAADTTQPITTTTTISKEENDTDVADVEVVAATDETTSSAAAAVGGINFAAKAFVVAIVATTTTTF